jgi:hypothetical protein
MRAGCHASERGQATIRVDAIGVRLRQQVGTVNLDRDLVPSIRQRGDLEVSRAVYGATGADARGLSAANVPACELEDHD